MSQNTNLSLVHTSSQFRTAGGELWRTRAVFDLQDTGSTPFPLRCRSGHAYDPMAEHFYYENSPRGNFYDAAFFAGSL